MKLRRSKQPAPTRAQMLAAKPMRHPKVVEGRTSGGELELMLSIEKSRLGRWLSRRPNEPIQRRFELDALGEETWRMMDGQTPVRAMIERFAQSHQLNLREAEVAILAYLQSLAGRGIMLLVVPDETPGDSSP